MKRLLLAIFGVFSIACAQAQLLTWTPPFPTENDASQNLAITLDATLGNGTAGLQGYTPTNDVHVHIGVITSLSTGPSDWKYVRFQWATTAAVSNAASTGTNRWTYTINGSLRTFFNITNANESIRYIAILFRNGAGTRVHRNADGSDMYIPISAGDFNVRLTQPAMQPMFVPQPQSTNWGIGTNFTVTGVASASSTMKLYHNGAQIGTTASNATSVTANSTVNTLGSQTIVVEANNGTITKFDTIRIFAGPSSSPTAALPAGVQDGINFHQNDPTRVTLVLRAPNKNKVTVIGDFNNWTEDLPFLMNRTPDGRFFWVTLQNLTPGVQYGFQYRVDDTIRVADPYSTLVLDPWNDGFITPATYPNLKPYPTGFTTGPVGVFQTNAPQYTWAVPNFQRPDKRNLIIYEMLMRDFTDAKTWNTVIDTLNYFSNLGVNAIKLMPINEFEGNISWGYNPNFYFSADKAYGPANTFKRFVDSCHARGIAVIMDIALNHSFSTAPMVQLYWDRVNFRPTAQNPWYNPFARHAFNVGYDMNHESLDTRYFTSRVLDYWMNEFKVDGFRFDLSKGFTQNNTCDNTGNNCNVGTWSAYDASRVAIWKRYYDTMMVKSPGSYAILEHFADNGEETELANYGMMFWGNMHSQYKQSVMGFANTNANLDWGLFTVRGWQQPHLITYAESHDEERQMYEMLNFGNNSQANYNVRNLNTALKRLELMGAFLFTIPGPKMIWQFGELGYEFSINHCPNGTVNSNCRTDPKPIRWDYNAVAERRNVYNVWSKIIKLRYHPWFRNNFTSNRIGRQLNGNWRWLQVTTDTSNLTVIGNFDVVAQTGTVTFQNAGTWYDIITDQTFTATGQPQNITLQPGEYRVYVNRNVNNVGTTAIPTLPNTGNRLEAGVDPNPAQQQFVVDLFLPAAGQASFDLVSTSGQVLRNLRQGFLPRGRQQLTFERPGMAAGSYFIRISTRSGNRVLPLILQ